MPTTKINFMRTTLFICYFLFLSAFGFGQFTHLFHSAYQSYPNLPKGILESVSWSNTHMRNISIFEQESCSGMPRALGVMGVFVDGKNYFNENTLLIESITGISVEEQLSSVENQISSYAQALNQLYSNYFLQTQSESKALYLSLLQLSEIPDFGAVNNYAQDAQIYQVLAYMTNEEFAQSHQFEVKNYDLKTVFGSENLKILKSPKIQIENGLVRTVTGQNYQQSVLKSSEYGPAIWNPAPNCNYSSRNGTAISAITIHTIQGSYAGAISWSQNCESNVSFHYVLRSSDGQVTQMVLEANKAWHVGSENPYTIGYEHEGWVNDASWYTEAMYQSSAALSRDIVNSGYGIPPLRTFFGEATVGLNTLGNCTKIKGHQHYANQTHNDPGVHWNWEKYYKLINNNPTISTITTANGDFYDTGGPNGNYANDERMLWLIQPANVSSINLEFTEFDLESNWDFLFIYDGPTTDSPLIGKYTGAISPGIIHSSTGALLIEFRSDCATNKAGWKANYTSVSNTVAAPVTTIVSGSPWKTSDFNVLVNDNSSQSTIDGRYYLIADRSSSTENWNAQATKGFLLDDFSNFTGWTNVTGNFTVQNNQLVCEDDLGNTNTYHLLTQNNTTDYLYHWKQEFYGLGSNQRAGLHFMCSDPNLPNRGNSYFVFLREGNDEVHIYSVANDVFTLRASSSLTLENHNVYDVKVTYSPTTGWIKVYIDNQLINSWQDTNPLTSGNSVSFRTANAKVKFEDLAVYQSRQNIVQVSIGENELMRYESVDAIPSGRMLALSNDLNAWSAIDTLDFLIDQSSPLVNFIHDGSSVDINEFTSNQLEANWSFSDPHSSILYYEYAVGTTMNDTDVLSWTNNGLSTSFSIPFTGVLGTTYYISVRTKNHAGLVAQASSNGQKMVEETSDLSIMNSELASVKIYPNPFSNQLFLRNVPLEAEVVLYDVTGKICYQGIVTQQEFDLSLEFLKAGSYQLQVKYQGISQFFKVIKQ